MGAADCCSEQQGPARSSGAGSCKGQRQQQGHRQHHGSVSVVNCAAATSLTQANLFVQRQTTSIRAAPKAIIAAIALTTEELYLLDSGWISYPQACTCTHVSNAFKGSGALSSRHPLEVSLSC
jgi:hypothetical protein